MESKKRLVISSLHWENPKKPGCSCGQTGRNFRLELEQVLMRSKFDRYQPEDVRAAFVALVRKHAVLVAVSATDESNVKPQCRDPKDDQFWRWSWRVKPMYW